ncbi:MBL fold metallo-hydrolase [Lacrimispora sp. 210928-DFI.3.58]|uniref:MBL fold metallo-hydrolase n=1 Tax=Lacrimispora sp. 210928-DFI.3.58 TaxID=2883214 RepID=UPI0015B4080F|nr:MBL fold metallo-hydrolase [Lacrimispora sp. 210928-DFI.3.58]MCB7318869.1 MBL fold metallo-hydrolase [Lacrimispora sp. 210928-DFI.3.58]
MKITYIHHSSFMAELEQVVFLFDYFEGEIPDYDKEKPLLVLASHRHGDHFSKEIFRLAEEGGKVGYLLSDDIWRRQVPEELLGRTVFIGPGEEKSLDMGETVKVKAFRSTDEGVAFLIEAEGKTIYHAGDLNNWVWEGEREEDNRRMSERYHEELDKLAGTHIDVAFMLIDPRQEKDFYLGMDDFMRKVGADVVFPMHFWEDFGVTERFKALACSEGYRDRVKEIHRRGESFEV